MKKDNTGELIDVIRQVLKEDRELPYKEGAWENFRHKYVPSKGRRLSPVWRAAAAMAVVALGALTTYRLATNDSPRSTSPGTQTEHRLSSHGRPAAPDHTNREALDGADRPQEDAKTQQLLAQRPFETMSHREQVSEMQRAYIHHELAKMQLAEVTTAIRPESGSRAPLMTSAPPRATSIGGDAPVAVFRNELGDQFALAQKATPDAAGRGDVEQNIRPRKLNLSRKLELGAFLSPSTTERNFNVGGGVLFAYQLNDKLALRTGASFNQYEVGMLASEVNVGGREMHTPNAPGGGASLISKDVPYRANSLLMPDLNSVTGKVQTLDIPLELRYNLSRQLYATGGLSYAVVLSQERLNHYTEYTDAPIYSSASDSNAPTNSPVNTVSTTVAASENNVNTNGFGGFVNFSIGRKTQLGKSVKLSVEPFVKLPVGQFKRADMNYTNGGVKIITHF